MTTALTIAPMDARHRVDVEGPTFTRTSTAGTAPYGAGDAMASLRGARSNGNRQARLVGVQRVAA